MRVLVLLPTTGKLNRVLRIDPYPDLVHSFVVRQGDVERLPITRKYADLTSQGGPLAALGAPVTPGLYRLLLAGPIDAGDSWQLPVLLAHLAVALGEKLAEEPAEGDIVLWSTGAVDVDLNIVHHDYMLPAKVACSRAALQKAVAAGAQIVAILPASAREDAPKLHGMLAEIGVQHPRVEIVDSVVAARGIVEEALGRTPAVVSEAASRPVPPAPEPARDTASARSGSHGLWKIPALLASGAAMALTVLFLGYALVPSSLPTGTPGTAAPRIPRRDAAPAAAPHGQVDAKADPSRAIPDLPPPNPVADTSRDNDVPPPVRPEILPFKAPEPPPDARSEVVPAPPPDARPEAVPAPPPETRPEVVPAKAPSTLVPVKLQELRAENNGSCVPYIVGDRRTPPLATEVALEGADHFHDSAGRNLCGLEWTLTSEAAQAGVQGFDIVDLTDRSGSARLERSGAAGISTRIRIVFTREFRNTNPITYNVKLEFGGAAPPEQVQQFRHAVR